MQKKRSDIFSGAEKMTFAIGQKDNESDVKCIYVLHIAPGSWFSGGGGRWGETMGAEKRR